MKHAPSKTNLLRRISTSRPLVTGLATLLILLVLYAAAGFLLAPWLLQKYFPELVDRQLGASGSVSTVHINPFRLTLEATDLVIAEKNDAPALQVGRVYVDFEAAGLLSRTWTFREIRIDRPIISANLDANSSLNLSRLFAPKPTKAAVAKTSGAAEPLPQLLLQHLLVTGGDFSFKDHTVEPVARAQFNPVNIEMHDVSTLSEHRGEHVLTARLPGGGSLQWQGRFTVAPIDSSGSITLKDAKLTTLWKFVQDHLAIAEPAGSYDLALRYRIRNSKGGYDLQADDLSLRMKDVGFAQKRGGPALGKLATIVFAGGSADLRKRTLAFQNVTLGEGAINIAIDENGTPDWATLIINTPARTAAPKDAAAASAARPWQIDLPKIKVGPLALSVTDHSRIKPLQVTIDNAQADFSVAATTGSTTQISIDNGAINLKNLQVLSDGSIKPLIALTNADLTGATFNLQEKSVRAKLLRLSGGATLVERDADGKFGIAEVFARRRPEPTPDSGYKFVIDRAEIASYAVALVDRTMAPVLAYDLENIKVAAEKLSYPLQHKATLELASQIKPGGTLQAIGTVDALNQTADVRVNASAVVLAPIAGLIGRHTTLNLATGNAGTEGRLVWNGKSNPATLRYIGAAAVTDVELRIAGTAERLVSWQRLAATGLNYSLAENRLSITELRLSQPYAKLVINKDRGTNFSGLVRPVKTAADTAVPKPATGPPLAITLEHVKLERGAMDFSDLSLIIPFATHIKTLNGTSNGISFAPESRANLKLEGRVGDYGLARAEGTFQVLAPKKFTDITISFRNVALPLLSPYTATFAGRKIEAGKLALDLQYKINNSELAGENKILLEKVVLGERVNSPKALDLPLDLAIALLTDSDGKINLAVPVTGNVDNPQFDYGDIIAKAIGSTLTSIIAAPFRALGAIFGGSAETLGDIIFDPGSARILPTEYEKLRRVADGLQKRPQLKLMVQGTYHPQNDSYALRTKLVRNDLAAREGLNLAKNEDPGPVGFASAKTQRALEDLFGDTAGNTDAVAQFTASFGKTAGREVSRVSPALAATGSGAGDPTLYEALYAKLIEQKTLPPSALPDLARNRADAITAAFIKRLKFDAVRLGNTPAAATTEVADNGIPVKLTFAPIE